MSGSSLGNQIGFIYQIMNLKLTTGAGVLTSQYWGRKDSGFHPQGHEYGL